MRFHPTDYSSERFAFGPVWEPRGSRAYRSETCERCGGEGLVDEILPSDLEVPLDDEL